jgi:Tol biopolymer transport system component
MRGAQFHRLVAAAAAVISLATCASARAAFPGGNGDLAIQTVSGGGIELVQPDGAGGRRICTDRTLCGYPRRPRFSPNGRTIVFTDAASTAIEMVAPDGTCLWCLAGKPLTTGFGYAAAFASDGAVTFVQETADVLKQVRLATDTTRTILAPPISDAAWSATGAAALVRDGWLWLRTRHGALRRLTGGTAPSWSPRGTDLAFARAGSIWTIAVRPGARAHRLARGSSPAWAPDGGRIAYVAPGGRVWTMGRSGRDRRPVGAVRGRTVDWQPLPRRAG